MRGGGALGKLLRRAPATGTGGLWHAPADLTPPPRAVSSLTAGDGQTSQQVASRAWPVRRAAGALVLTFAASGTFSTVAWSKDRPPSELLPKEVILYQYEACPFCNKVKAFLDYHDIPYQVVEVNPLGKKELSWSEYKKVPVLVVDGEQLNDSTAIISTLHQRFESRSEDADYSRSEDADYSGREEEEKWRTWVDEHLVHMLSPNIYRTPSEALEAFDYIATNGNFTSLERATGKYIGAAAMYMISKRLKKRHKIINARASLYEALNVWIEALGGRKFMGGSKPNLADLAVFGVLRPIRHLKAGNDMIANTGIGTWYEQMEAAVGAPSRVRGDMTESMTQTVTETLK